MNKHWCFLNYILLIVFVFGAAAFKVLLPDTDDPILKGFLDKLAAYSAENKQEKIFLQTDKTYYTAGDTIWFKGYVLMADSHAPSGLSDILHIALLAGDQQEVQRKRLEITSGLASGYMVVPPDTDPGNYRLVAYTRWMRNYDARFVYTKQIPIFNFIKTGAVQAFAAKVKPLVSFFPEGGYLVNGLESKLAYKAIDSTGKSMAIAGTVVNNAGKIVVTFKGSENGLGNFMFRPEAGKTYSATITTPQYKPFAVGLPKPEETGFVIRADNRSDSLCVVTIQKRTPAGRETADKIFLVAKSSDKVFFAAAKSFGDKEENLTFIIPKKNVPEGVAQLTLFSQDGKPRAERLIYVHQHQRLTISVKPTKQSYAPREDVDVEVEVKDEKGAGTAANLSVSVTDENALLAPEENILSYLYLGSNVTGTIENAPAFLANDLPETKQALDNVLLTQVWRRSSWPEILVEDRIGKKFTPEKDLVFRGRATTADGKAVPATLLNILLSGTGNAYAAFTDSEGYFSVIIPDYETSGEALFRFFENDDALPGIKVVPALEPITNWLPGPGPGPAAAVKPAYWQKAYDYNRIQKAYADVTNAITQHDNLSQLVLFNKAQKGTSTYNINEYVQFKNLAELFDEAIEPVSLKKTKAGLESRVYSRQAKKYFNNSPLYIIDGKPTFDNKVVLSLPTEQIARLEVFNTTEHLQKFSLMGRDGVISIYTKSNNLDLQNLSDSTVPFEGLFTGQGFKQPSLKQPANAAIPALQPRLYWQAAIKTDANGKAKITFKNAGNLTRYRIVVEGITLDGLPGVGEKFYEVAKPN